MFGPRASFPTHNCQRLKSLQTLKTLPKTSSPKKISRRLMPLCTPSKTCVENPPPPWPKFLGIVDPIRCVCWAGIEERWMWRVLRLRLNIRFTVHFSHKRIVPSPKVFIIDIKRYWKVVVYGRLLQMLMFLVTVSPTKLSITDPVTHSPPAKGTAERASWTLNRILFNGFYWQIRMIVEPWAIQAKRCSNWKTSAKTWPKAWFFAKCYRCWRSL